MADELQNDLEALRAKVRDLGKYLEVDAKEKQVVEINHRMSAPDFWTNPRAQDVMRERAYAVKAIDTWKGLTKDVEDSLELKAMAEMENDTSILAEIQTKVLEIRARMHKAEVAKMLSGEVDANPANVTIAAGQGGTEACDWTAMLYRLYTRWAERRGYKIEVQDIQSGDEAGIKSVAFQVTGEYAYGYLKAEKGVHRLVRISPFDANKRRQTSFAAMDVTAEISDDIVIDIKDDDLKVDTYRSGGAGGQHVNKTESAIRITHMPTGAVVSCQMERSQHKNRSTAMKMLRSKLYALELQKRQDALDAVNSQKNQIGWGSQIRSYVLQPYQMVKDHRTGEESSQTNAVLDGEIDKFLEAYLLGKKIDKNKAAAADDL